MAIDRESSQPTQPAELRRQAEALLSAKSAAETFHGTKDDLQRLLHELQVHEIELEMQNEELRQAKVVVDTALERYSDLFDFAPVSYLTLERNGTTRTVNLTCASLLGIRRSRLLGRRFDHFVAVADRTAFAAFFTKLISSSDRGVCEVALLNKGKSPLFARIEAVSDASGQECRLALIDISERKRAEGALLKVEEAAELALLKVEEAAAEALRLVEEADEAHYSDQEATEAARGKLEKVAKLARLNLEEAAKVARREEKKPPEMSQIEKNAAMVALLKMEKAAKVALLKVEKAAEVALAKVETNAVALQMVKLQADLLLKEKEAAEAATRTKSQFLANMSHELRTPMTGVLGMLELVLDGRLEAEQREYIETARTSARSLVRILNDILDLTKIEAGKLSLEANPFSVRKCVEATRSILQSVARSKGLDLDFTVADDVPEFLLGDQTRINQILTNLAGNAVKFTDKGKVELHVTAGGSRPDGKRDFTFTVADTGIGIHDNKKHLLFRSFSQVDDSHTRNYSGTGLGLVISKEIAAHMGGTISFTSEKGKGSVFSCTIPLGESEEKSTAIIAAGKTAPAGVTHLSAERTKPRLLVAEDEIKVIEMWENGQYDLILMDVQMPRMNGFEAAGAIREKERSRGGHIPIIAMTAHALKEDEARCFAAGMNSYLSKPIDFKNCLQVIGDNLKQKM